MNNTPHQEQSKETFFHMEVQMGLHDPLERYRVWKENIKLGTHISLHNIVNIAEAQQKLLRGEEAYVEVTVFDN